MAKPSQGVLIPLKPEEIAARGKMLARLIGEAKSLKEDHAEEKKVMKEQEDELSRRIHKIAKAIREGTEEPE